MRRSRLTQLTCGLALALAAEALVCAPALGAGRPPSSADNAGAITSAEATASRSARASGKPVVVDSLTSETQQVIAQPDGSFAARMSAEPVRKQEKGSWVDLDATLEPRADGTLGPSASVGELSISGGGPAGTEIASYAQDGRSYSLRSPYALPRPSIDRDTATYSDVLPDVDLVVKATTTGFSHNWVVKSRAAANDPRIRSLDLGVETKGLTARADTGGVAYVDASGIARFWTPTPVMWDSASVSGAKPGNVARSSRAAVVRGPAARDRVAKVAVSAGRDHLSLEPATSLLDDPAAVFPIVIDPYYRTYEKTRNGWTAVWNNFPTKSFWQTDHSLGAGYEGYQQFKVVRSYFRFDTTAIGGKHIIKGELNVRQIHAASCTARPTEVYRTGSIGTGTTWNNQPARYAYQSSNSSTAGCGTGTAMVGWNVTNGAETLASASSATGTFMIRAKDESDKIAWKQYDDAGADLVVYYVSKPTQPGSVFLRSSSGTSYPCGTSTDPRIIGTTSISVGAKLTSPDGANASLKSVFRRRDMAASADMADVAGNSVASGGESKLSWTVTNGRTYRFKVKNRASWTFSGTSDYLDSAFNTDWCYFKVDTSRPAAPAVTPIDFTACASPESPEDCTAMGSTHTPGLITIDSASTDAISYHWRLNGGAINNKTLTTPGMAHNISVTPDRDVNQLEVWSKDAVNQSTSNWFTFRVDRRKPEVVWSFADTDPAASSGTAPEVNLDLGGSQPFPFGRSGSGLELTGSTPAQSTTTAVGTAGDFTAAAWVRVDANTPSTILAATAGPNSDSNAFELGFEPAPQGSTVPSWVAGRRSSTGALTGVTSATGVLGAWSHVAATYTDATKTLTLYVDGVARGSVVYPTAAWPQVNWKLGCGSVASTQHRCTTGGIDEVQLYAVDLSAEEILDLASPLDALNHPVVSSAAFWAMDDADTAGTADEPRFGADLALVGAVGFAPSTVAPLRVLNLPGTPTQQARVGHPVTDALGSFTIVANVRPTDPTKSQVIAQQRGVNRDSWTLGYEAEADGSGGRWVFQRSASDGATATTTEVRSGVNPSVADDFALVAGVYNARTKSIALYVNGATFEDGPDPAKDALQDAAFTTPWAAGGRFDVGNGTLNGAANAPFVGEIDRVEMLAGPLDVQTVADYYQAVWQ